MAEQLIKVRISYDGRREALVYPDPPLGGVRVGLRFQWLALQQRWGLWLHDLDESPMFGPALLVGGINLWAAWQYDPRVPPGQLFVYSPDKEPPSLTSADTEALLLYRSAT